MAPSTERRQSSAEQTCLRAVAAATRPWPPDGGQQPASGWQREVAACSAANAARMPATNPRRALRTTTGLALLAVGLILLFAIRAAGGLVNVHAAGLILIVVGAAWLWLPIRDKRTLLGHLFGSAMAYVSFDDGSGAKGATCSLDELLGPPAAASRADPHSPAADGVPVNGLHD